MPDCARVATAMDKNGNKRGTQNYTKILVATTNSRAREGEQQHPCAVSVMVHVYIIRDYVNADVMDA